MVGICDDPAVCSRWCYSAASNHRLALIRSRPFGWAACMKRRGGYHRANRASEDGCEDDGHAEGGVSGKVEKLRARVWTYCKNGTVQEGRDIRNGSLELGSEEVTFVSWC